MRTILFFLAGAILLTCSVPQLRFSLFGDGPALWSVRDADSTIYLFGTVHALDGRTFWRTQKVNKAFDQSQELWVEVPEAGDSEAMAQAAAPTIERFGVDYRTPLMSRLTGEEQEILRSAATRMGTSVDAYQSMKPWLASMALSGEPVTEAGMSGEIGADAVFARLARADGKPVRGLETAESQLETLARLPEPAQLLMLRSTLHDLDDGSGGLNRMVRAWSTGDTETLEKLSVGPMRESSSEIYHALLVGRNEAWANQLEERLKGKGVSFVAVGAAHLVGPDSVQEILRRRGIQSRRE